LNPPAKDKSVGGEITEAFPEYLARIVALGEREEFFPECIPILRFIPGESRRTSDAIRASIGPFRLNENVE
jgi:hypothetical protein